MEIKMESPIRIANAPCSWGALEFAGMAGEPIGYRQMLDELRETGYTGTELGDWGFMPAEPAALRAELEQRELAMVGAFVPVALKYAEAHADGAAEAVKVARLLAAVAEQDGRPPLIVLADANGSDPARTSNAGRVTPDLGLSAAEWQTFAYGAEQVARAVRETTGLATAFHHHCAGYVETPDEIARLLELTDPALLGLVFDTGHFLFGAAGAEEQTVQAALDRFGERIWHMHFKDCHPRIAAQSRAEGWDYFEAVRRGVFCELGQGAADFAAATAWLRARDYRGWIVVEQDVLPGMGAPKQSAARNRAYLRTLGL
jgi:inosose dehydratase